MPNDPMTTTGQNLERLNKEGTTTSRSSSKKVVKKTPGRPSPEAIIEKNASKAIEDINEVLRGEQAGLEMPRRIVMIALPVIALLVRKNRNYGDSFSRSPELAPDLTANQGLRTRLSDKFARLKSLLSGEPDRVGESLLDTVRDMVGYFLLWLVEHSLKDAPVHMEWDVPESIGCLEESERDCDQEEVMTTSEEIATMEDQIDDAIEGMDQIVRDLIVTDIYPIFDVSSMDEVMSMSHDKKKEAADYRIELCRQSINSVLLGVVGHRFRDDRSQSVYVKLLASAMRDTHIWSCCLLFGGAGGNWSTGAYRVGQRLTAEQKMLLRDYLQSAAEHAFAHDELLTPATYLHAGQDFRQTDAEEQEERMGKKYCGTCGTVFGYSVWGKENRYEPPCCVGSHWTVDKPART